MKSPSAIEAVLAPIDMARRSAYRAFGPSIRTWMVDRDRRVLILGVAVVLSSLSLTLGAPLALLALGPVVLGVPHLLADVRYLWIRPRYHRRPDVLVAVALPLLLGATASSTAAWGCVAAAGACLVAKGPRRRRVLLFAGALIAAYVSFAYRREANLLLAHGHNVVAILLWWRWRPERSASQGVVLALVALCSIVLLSGAADAAFTLTPLHLGPSLSDHLANLAPFASEAAGRRFVLCFAFAQAVHYGVWLRLVPEDDRPRPAPRTFASSFRALREDFGVFTLAVVAVLAVGLACWATLDLRDAREGYFRFAAFHGQLELAAAALLFLERRRVLVKEVP